MGQADRNAERIRLLEAFILDIMPVVDLLAKKTDSEFYKALRRRATFLGVVDYAEPEDSEAAAQGNVDV